MNTTTTETLETQLWVLMSEKLGLEQEQIKMTDSFADDLGVDSLDLFALLTDVEKEFSIKIPDEEAEKLTTVKALVNYLHAHLS
ncbi:acyl carrier protein [Dinghuibacter silviterrae]|uniref:Acyl carrier protein n=1 Tax=Dinghuibacter silviterrae TaxID=1539049 RepID=A0A4R8DW25_9BACT|nr:acyl carrier protein [Dinghuibacter silviterrae]TDX01685.1 acyl carrier protein [Dinghuibacter silviterrae]